MRILLVNDYAREYGGAETYVLALERLLREAGHTVRLIADRPRPIHYLSRVFNPWYLLKFLLAIARFRPDAVHIHKYNLVYSFTPALAAKLLGRRAVVTLHDVGLFCPDGYGLLPDGRPCDRFFGRHCFGSRCWRSRHLGKGGLRRLNFLRNALQVPILARSADLFLCPSIFLVDWASRYYGRKAVHFPYFSAAGAAPPEPARPPAGAPLRLLFAGRLVPEKGLQFLLPALRGLDLALTVAGEGPYRGALEALAAREGVTHQVRYLGKVPNARMPDLLAEADAVVLPSFWLENNPLFAYEAMRAAKPILAARVGGLPDLVEEGSNGWLFAKGDAAAARQALERCLRERERLPAMGRAGHAKLRRDYAPADHLRKLEAFYRGEG